MFQNFPDTEIRKQDQLLGQKRKGVNNKGNNYHTKLKDVSNKSSFSFLSFVRNNIFFNFHRPLITLGIWNKELKN